MIKKGHVFQAKLHDVQLKILDVVEPNNGRMRCLFQFIVNGDVIDNKLIKTHTYLLNNLENYVIDSHDGKYIFLPLEYQSLVYLVDNDIYLQVAPLTVDRNNSYVSNYFEGNKLIINNTLEILIFDILRQSSTHLTFPFHEYLIMDSEFKQKELYVTYKNLKDFKVYTKKYDFQNMKLENN